MFKIISVGWDCADVLENTLRSIQQQDNQDWEAHIVDDASGEAQQTKIVQWCESHDSRWGYTLNPENYGAVRSQYEGIRTMDPHDDDVVVFLDLDGDQFAHSAVLDRLLFYYSDPEVLVTYGSYRPIPDPGGDMPVAPFPPEVVAANTYRKDTLEGCRFNHLRTAKWGVLKNIPDSYYRWPDGEWLRAATDYTVMMGCLELAGGRYRCINETLLLYNAQQPHPDNVSHPEETRRCCEYVLNLPPLKRFNE